MAGARLHVGLIAALALAIAACAASPALAGTAIHRYAEPGGNGPDPCLETDPCEIEAAVEGAVGGTVVHLLPGAYSLTDTLTVPSNVEVLSDGFVDGGGDATVTITDPDGDGDGVEVLGSSTLTGFGIVLNATSGEGRALDLGGGLGRNLTVSTATGDFACNVVNAILTDSYCVNSDAGNGIAVGSVTTGTSTAELRNVTAAAVGPNSIGVWASSTAGNTVTVNGRNVIALANGFDEGAAANGTTATTVIDLTSSNFDSIATAIGFPELGTVDYTLLDEDPTNQDDPSTDDNPQLVSPFLGDPHQLAESPTIDAGSDSGGIGEFDFEHDPRIAGDAPDIGADEFVPPLDDTAPDTDITKQPKKKTTKRKAKLKFSSSEAGSTFECKLDKKGFKPCESPFKKKVKAGKKHKFLVRATDATGNTDPTPAKAKWKVLSKD